MAEERLKIRPSLRDAMTNWRESDLPFFEKLFVTFRNYSRRFGGAARELWGGTAGPAGASFRPPGPVQPTGEEN